MEKILLTGSRGALAEAVIDELNKKKIKHITAKNYLEFLKKIKKIRFDKILHLGASNRFGQSFDNYFFKNVLNFYDVLDYCKNTKILLASTDKVNDLIKSKKEINQIDSYALSKLVAEKMLIEKSQKKNLKFIIIRFPSLMIFNKRKKNIFYYLTKNINKTFKLKENKNFNNNLLTKDQAVDLIFEKMKFLNKDCNKIINVKSNGKITTEKLKKILKKNKKKFSVIRDNNFRKNTNFKGFENKKYNNKDALKNFLRDII